MDSSQHPAAAAISTSMPFQLMDTGVHAAGTSAFSFETARLMI